MSSAVVHDKPLSPCNNWAVTHLLPPADGTTHSLQITILARQYSAKLQDSFSLPHSVKSSSEKPLARNHGCCLWKAVGEKHLLVGAQSSTETSERRIFIPIDVSEMLL